MLMGDNAPISGVSFHTIPRTAGMLMGDNAPISGVSFHTIPHWAVC